MAYLAKVENLFSFVVCEVVPVEEEGIDGGGGLYDKFGFVGVHCSHYWRRTGSVQRNFWEGLQNCLLMRSALVWGREAVCEGRSCSVWVQVGVRGVFLLLVERGGGACQLRHSIFAGGSKLEGQSGRAWGSRCRRGHPPRTKPTPPSRDAKEGGFLFTLVIEGFECRRKK